MNIYLDNVDLNSSSGPNHFGKKLKKYLEKLGASINDGAPDIQLSFIEAQRDAKGIPLIQRLDGIYFNRMFNYNEQNKNIMNTYTSATGVVFQTEFNRRLTFQYFGHYPNSTIIRNGADLEMINQAAPLENDILAKHDRIWCCASSWRPHKRLRENIEYFLFSSGDNDCLVVAGKTSEMIQHERVYYVGQLNITTLISLYKASSVFVHLAWLDHCPNVVVDAKACGCEIICSSSGGTKEIAGQDARLILEDEWDLSPTDLYKPPKLNFQRTKKNKDYSDIAIDMTDVAQEYYNFLEKNI